MAIMGLSNAEQLARSLIANTSFSSKFHFASVKEYMEQIVGGLIGAFEVTDDKIYIEAAKTVANLLMPAYEDRSRVPVHTRYEKTLPIFNPPPPPPPPPACVFLFLVPRLMLPLSLS